MDVLEQAKQELVRRRRAVRLKTVVPDVESLTGANRFDSIGKTLDVYGMVLNGIDIVQTINDAITVMRSMDLLHESEIGLTSLAESARVTQLASTMEATDSVMSAGRYLFAANALGVLTTYVGVWMSLAGAWAQAKADILTDNAKSGASLGAVLGANDAGPHYIASQNFWMRSRPSYPAYREAENAAKNIHNIAFVAGYAEGKSLKPNQKGNLFKFLHARMTIVDQAYYTSGPWNEWSAGKRRDYYFQCAANFRNGVLK
jgi:hypothetical protein